MDYKTNIIGSWREISSSTSSFKMTDSTMILSDTTLFPGLEAKYHIIKDTLITSVIEGQDSKYKILLLTTDSLIISDSLGVNKYIKIK